MSSFSAYLTVSTFQTWINSATVVFHQEADSLGRPASPTFGGKLTVSFNSPTDPLVTAWAISPTKQWSGSLTYINLEGQTLKVIEFSNAFCTDLVEEFDGTTSSAQMVMTIVISPEKVSVAGIKHDNNWPPTSAF